MENAGYIILSRQTALGRNLQMLAHNIANMNTNGYRGERPLFQEFLTKTDDGQRISQSIDRGLVRDMTPGRIETTDNPLDVALSGKGFLVVDVNGEERYTRNGSLRLNAEGNIVTNSGQAILGEDGPINIPAGAHSISITKDGVIQSSQGEHGRLRFADFENEYLLLKEAGGLFKSAPNQEVLAAENIEVLQGSLERSNVQGILAMTELINVTRAYTRAASFAKDEDQRQMNAIRTISNMRGN
ncbi:flagellar basal-body rod protein FlgF [Kiloniella sp. b19]|uniref:flagellar basal-body rod protein FlgF n=1 Tax=Kiloniella sp. GXU_MW_B19 TaxID=3141326 RepID=UPI0031DE53CC